MTAEKHRLRSVDALRGAAALGVLISHAMRATPPRPPGGWYQTLFTVTGYGSLGVPLFFVISGYCIHRRWAQAASSGGAGDRPSIDFRAFWRRRIVRLYPPYFVALCLTMGIVVVGLATGGYASERYPSPAAWPVAVDFLAHALMLHGFHPVLDSGGGNPVYWTLAREEYLYLLYLPLIAARRRLAMPILVLCVAALGLVTPPLFAPWVGSTPWWGVVTSSAVVLWIQWVLGALAAEAEAGLVRLPAWLREGWSLPLWAGVLILGEVRFPEIAVLTRGLFFFVLLTYCVSRERAGRWPVRGLAAWLPSVGVFSYSLYLVHHPVQVVFTSLALKVVSIDSAISSVGLSLFLAIVAFAAGKLFFILVERHFLNDRRGSRFVRRESREEAGSVALEAQSAG